jgi:KTSC domain
MPSTVIRSYEYLPEKNSLIVTFISGSRYLYTHVSAETFEAFKGAFSKGTFLNQHIKPFHEYKKLTG